MKRSMKWFGISILLVGMSVWLVWAIIGDAPLERPSTALCQDALARRLSFYSSDMGRAALANRDRVNPTSSTTVAVVDSLDREVKRYCGE